MIGGELAKRDIFPYGMGFRLFLPSFLQFEREIGFCPMQYQINEKFGFFIHKNYNNIFIGDSLVEEAYSSKIYDLNYELIGVSGATIDCTEIISKYINIINPKNVIIYLGGNDADGQSNYDSEKAFLIYKNFVKVLNNIKSIQKVYIVGVNYGLPSRRDINYVVNLNSRLKKIQNETKVFFVDSFDELDFTNKSFQELSYDGEHLNYYGYEKWFDYLSDNIKDFKLN